MRATGQVRSDQMALRALISNGVSATAGRIASLESSLSAVATSGDYADLSNKPTLGALASQDTVTHSQVSDWSSATSGFATVSSLAAVATSGAYSDLTGKPTLGDLAALDSITTTKISDWSSATSSFVTAASLAPYAKTGDLASVALSGAYGDLSGVPTLGALAAQDSVTHLQVSDWNNATSGFLTEHQDISGLLPKAGGEITGNLAWSKTAEISGESKQHRVTISMNASSLNFGAYDSTHQHWVWFADPNGVNTFYGNASTASKATADGNGNTISTTYATKSSFAPTEISLTDAGYVDFTTLKAWRSGNVVQFYLYFKLPATAPASWTTIASGLPAPMMQLKTTAATWTASYARPVALSVETDGAIKAIYGKASTSYALVCSYVTSDGA